MLDAAREAKVSIMAVSNVAIGSINQVREDTQNRVRNPIQNLDYRAQSQVRGLRLSRSWAIGMHIVMRRTDFFTLPWMSRMVAGLSNYLNAKVIVHAATRELAIARPAQALEAFDIIGPKTNIPAVVAILRSERFQAGDVHTDLIPEVLGEKKAWTAPNS